MSNDSVRPQSPEVLRKQAEAPETAQDSPRDFCIKEILAILQRECPERATNEAADLLYRAAVADCAGDPELSNLLVDELSTMGFDWFEAQGYVVSAIGLLLREEINAE